MQIRISITILWFEIRTSDFVIKNSFVGGAKRTILAQLRHYIIPVRAMDQPLRTPLYFPIPNRFGNGCGPTISGHHLDSVRVPKFPIPKMSQKEVVDISPNELASACEAGETIPKEQEKLPWLQLFLQDQLCGLKCFEASVNRERKVEPLEHFAQCFLQLLDKHGENIRDEVGFVAAYKHLQALQGSQDPSPTDLQIAHSSLEWIFARCLRDIYSLGSFTLTSMHFCGAAEPSLMLDEEEFHGYNERCATARYNKCKF